MFEALETGEITVDFGAGGEMYSGMGAGGGSSGPSRATTGDRVAWDGTVWLNRAPEMMFEALIILTVSLRGIAALLRRDEVRSLLSFNFWVELRYFDLSGLA